MPDINLIVHFVAWFSRFSGFQNLCMFYIMNYSEGNKMQNKIKKVVLEKNHNLGLLNENDCLYFKCSKEWF